MKITGIETIQVDEFPNIVWVEVQTDEGIIGLGETFLGAESVVSYIHEIAAPYLIGEDPCSIERHSRFLLNRYLGFSGTGAEIRANSALDIALWDILGQSLDVPIHRLLGGLTRDRIRVYNTCAGYNYVKGRYNRRRLTDNWSFEVKGPYEDLRAFMTCADDLAISLLEQGIGAMKIWPFDPAAEATGGEYISREDLKLALVPFEKIRRAVGDKMEIMVEFHSLWGLPAAKRIAAALEEFDPFWFEDPIRPDNMDCWASFASATRVPLCGSEVLSRRTAFRDLIEKGGVSIVKPDIAWVGGITEAKKIADLADTHHLPLAPHDCTGPVVYAACVHLSMSQSNAMIQESVRAFYDGWYRDVVTVIPQITNGFVYALEGPGLGTKLLPDVKRRADATMRATSARAAFALPPEPKAIQTEPAKF